MDKASTSYKAQLIADFIAAQHAKLKISGDGDEKKRRRPLMVSMQGPQGAGKSTLAAALTDLLVSPPYNLKPAVASLDDPKDPLAYHLDFYLTHQGLINLAQANPSNSLLQGRGPPGTHDTQLLLEVLTQISSLPKSNDISLPIFDKSLYNGQGDRSTETVPVDPDIDVFLLEGWSMGFEGLTSEDEVQAKWQKGETAQTHLLESLLQCNNFIRQLGDQIYPFFDCHIAISPLDNYYVYKWRLQQEHHMKRENGGRGMSDEAVKAFVDRYMPSYELYADRMPSGKPYLQLVYGEHREVVDVKEQG